MRPNPGRKVACDPFTISDREASHRTTSGEPFERVYRAEGGGILSERTRQHAVLPSATLNPHLVTLGPGLGGARLRRLPVPKRSDLDVDAAASR